ncbi:hypothetical protein SAMN04487751_1727 [Microbacterium saccharophilum]|uniref:Uncharacterized protein n=2 Tax=Microbacteriaceae TaxID=85023 RepID=A0A7Z7GD06_9MICO|nr:hypothetical protein SAMN04487751_1727 [Microbacterium saccharophilum]
MAEWRAGQSRRFLWFHLVAVTAIIAGLLAMHSLSLEEDAAGTVVSSAVVAGPDAAASVPVSGPPAPSCDETICETSHAATAVTCLIALMTLIILFLPARNGWISLLAGLRFLRGRSDLFTSGWPLLRPSLIALSISRT